MKKAVLKSAALGALILAGALATGQAALADSPARDYEITIRNATHGQVITPTVLIPHNSDFSLFEIGAAASLGLAYLAETGGTGELEDELSGDGDVDFDAIVVTIGVLPPGQSVVEEVSTSDKYLSTAAMLALTNDAFASVRGIELPQKGSIKIYANAYDAGSEANTEAPGDVPGLGGGNHVDPDPGTEGFVHVHAGIHGVGGRRGLNPAMHDWRNPVVEITITRIDDN
jgi:hypothetical protein